MADMFSYKADVWCPSCAEKIKEAIVKEIAGSMVKVVETKFPKMSFGRQLEIDLAEKMHREIGGYGDVRDTDDWPQAGSFEATDSPQHCGAGTECEEAEVLAPGVKIGALLGTELTDEGVRYLNEMLSRTNSEYQLLVHEFWREQFSSYELEKRKFYHCGGCEHMHPLGWTGDCREDAMRFTEAELVEKFGEQDEEWEEVAEDGGPAPDR